MISSVKGHIRKVISQSNLFCIGNVTLRLVWVCPTASGGDDTSLSQFPV